MSSFKRAVGWAVPTISPTPVAMGSPRSRFRHVSGHMRRSALVLSHADETALNMLYPPEGGPSPPYRLLTEPRCGGGGVVGG